MSLGDKNNFKDKLFNYEVEVDNDALWEVLEEHVPVEKKNKKGLIWWTFGSASIVMLIGLGITIFTNNTSHNVFESQPKIEEQAKIAVTSINNQKNNQTTTAETSEPTSRDLPTTSNPNQHIKNHSVNATQPIIFHDSPIVDSFDEQKVENQVEVQSEPMEVATSTIHSPDIIKENKTPSLTAVPMLATEVYDYYQYTMEEAYIIPLPKDLSNQLSRSWWVRPSIGIGTSVLNTKVKNISGDYQNFLSQNLSTLPTLEGSVLVGKDIHRKLSVYAGLKYQRLVTNLNFYNNATVEGTENGTIQTIIDPSGKKTSINGEVKTTVYNDYSANWYNYHHFVDLPIGLIYNFYNKTKIHLGAKIGATLNLYNHHEGATLNSNFTLNKFTSESHPYQIQWINPFVGMTAQYWIAPKMSIGVGIDCNTQFLNHLSEDAQIKNSHIIPIGNVFYHYQF